MKTASLFQNKTVFSLEIFPPKRTAHISTVYRMLDELKDVSPDFISVTYGIAGAADKYSTVEIAADVKNVYGIESVAHLPVAGMTRTDAERIVDALAEKGIENILALRGDYTEENRGRGDFAHAEELIRLIRQKGDFNILAACYPEGHPEAPDLETDLRYLKQKVDAGANHLITQLFFENTLFYSFLERARATGIAVPVEAGIMPVTNKKQAERMAELCKVQLPAKFVRMMEKYEHNPEALRDAGIAYAIDQIVDLAAQGVDGIHLYTMNNPDTAHRIHSAVKSLISVVS